MGRVRICSRIIWGAIPSARRFSDDRVIHQKLIEGVPNSHTYWPIVENECYETLFDFSARHHCRLSGFIIHLSSFGRLCSNTLEYIGTSEST